MNRFPCFLIFLWSLFVLNACNGGSGGSSTQQFQTLILASTAPPADVVNVAYPGFAFAVASGGTAPFKWSESGTLPPGLSLSTGGVLSGTPTSAGSFPITVTVDDSSSPQQTASQKVTIVISNGPQLAITSGTPPAGNPGYAYDGNSNGFSLRASGGLPPYKWSWTANNGSSLPAGLSISTNADSTGTISGFPTTAGNYNVVVKVSDSESPMSMVSSAYTIAISTPTSLAITSGSPPSGQAEKLYDDQGQLCVNQGDNVPPLRVHLYGFVLGGSGGIAPYRWSWAAGPGSSLPPGLNVTECVIGLSRRGSSVYGVCVRGTPIAAGSYDAVVTLTDSESPPMKFSANYTIGISPPPPIVISTIPLPAVGTLNSPYASTFTVASGGIRPFQWSESGALPPGLSFSAGGVLSGMPTETGSFPITIEVQDSVALKSAPQDFAIQISLHGFKATGSMEIARSAHTATLLGTGAVLVAGGYTSAGGLPTAELFDPSSGTFKPTGSMQSGRFQHSATLLSSALANGGMVLVAGGGTATAELFDPASGTFTSTGSMEVPRSFQTATLLNDGKVLVTGGSDAEQNPLASAEVFDPASGSFTPAGSMAIARYGHTATLINNGKVLIAGGTGPDGKSAAAAELFDPSTGTFTPTSSMKTGRYTHTATLLNSGKVLVTGGFDSNFIPVSTAEIFDPTSGSFASTGSMETARSFHTATSLKDGTVIVVGGEDASGNVLSSAEIFDPATGTFAPTGSMGSPRFGPVSTNLQNGAVLVTGGDGLATAEIYQ